MKQKVVTRWGSCRDPIDRLNWEVKRGKRTSIAGTGFVVYLNCVKKNHGHFKFKYDHSDFIWVDIYNKFCKVTMSFDVEGDVIELDPVDENSLNNLVEKST